MADYSDDITESLTAATSPVAYKSFTDTSSEVMAFPWSINEARAAFGLTCTGGANLSSSGTYVWQPGALIQEAISVNGSLGANQVLVALLSQSFGLTGILASVRPVTIAEGFNLSGALTGFIGALLADRLNIVSTNAPGLTYKQTLLEFVALNDKAARFLAGAILEALGISSSTTPIAKSISTLTQSFAISSTISTKLIGIVTAPEAIRLSDASVLKSVFKPTIREAISFDLGLIEPNGGFTAWTVNTRTGATTEYQNYEFNSFAQSGHHYLGASASGLYALDGDDDDGDPTVATLRSGYAQFGGSRYSSFKAAYLGIRGEDDVYLKLEAGTGETYTYQVKLQNQQTTKVRIGKGLRARYFAWELVTTGQDFDLDSVEFIPLVAQRRV